MKQAFHKKSAPNFGAPSLEVVNSGFSSETDAVAVVAVPAFGCWPKRAREDCADQCDNHIEHQNIQRLSAGNSESVEKNVTDCRCSNVVQRDYICCKFGDRLIHNQVSSIRKILNNESDLDNVTKYTLPANFEQVFNHFGNSLATQLIRAKNWLQCSAKVVLEASEMWRKNGRRKIPAIFLPSSGHRNSREVECEKRDPAWLKMPAGKARKPEIFDIQRIGCGSHNRKSSPIQPYTSGIISC